MDQLRNWLWPFDDMFLKVENLPGHLKEQARMRNRWRLDALVPFIVRWFFVVGFLGLSLYIADHFPDGIGSLLLHMFLFTAWVAAIGVTALLVWLYSMRPK